MNESQIVYADEAEAVVYQFRDLKKVIRSSQLGG